MTKLRGFVVVAGLLGIIWFGVTLMPQMILGYLGMPRRFVSAHAAAPTLQVPGRVQAPQGQQPERPTSTPYSGDLSIFESPGRDKRLQIDRVMKLLKIEAGATVADIGAGSGWFTVRAAKRVGATGMVLAEDINPAATKAIDERAKKEGFANVHTILGATNDPKLPAGSVDAVVMLKVYHEIAEPVRFAQRLRASLKPGALVGIIDRNGDGSGTDHGLPQAVCEKEMGEAGFKKVKKYDFTKGDGQDYFLIFAAK